MASKSTGWVNSSAPGQRAAVLAATAFLIGSGLLLLAVEDVRVDGERLEGGCDADDRGPGRRGVRRVRRPPTEPCSRGSVRDRIRAVAPRSLLRYSQCVPKTLNPAIVVMKSPRMARERMTPVGCTERETGASLADFITIIVGFKFSVTHRAGRILCRPVLGGLHHEYDRI
jgi:hypothetical protein